MGAVLPNARTFGCDLIPRALTQRYAGAACWPEQAHCSNNLMNFNCSSENVPDACDPVNHLTVSEAQAHW